MWNECGMSDFRRKYSVLESLLQHWENNVEVNIVPLEDSETIIPSNTQSPEEPNSHVSNCMLHAVIVDEYMCIQHVYVLFW